MTQIERNTGAPSARAPEEETRGEALWYKDAIIYHLHVKAFYDSDNDGIGDFKGLTDRLEYIKDLGATAVWVMPFYPSPMRDDGYDISEYKNVHPDYGTKRDFRQFVKKAHSLGLKVITELVINHTSDAHPWFRKARQAPKGSARRNFYVWSDDYKKYEGTRIIFTDTENSNWTWDEEAGQYYWHRFFSHQPDLNHDNPQVFKAVMNVMRFWLDAGVDGLRLDAIPYLIEREGTDNENLPETHEVLKRMRAEMDKQYQDRIFIAEANQWPEDVLPYFGDGDECHMAFHFPLMPRIYMAVAQEDRHPIVEIMHQTPDIPDAAQWAIFLRNHDELTLEMVTDRERDYMYQTYAADPQMRINIGIRRRLAPLMENDRPRIELLNSLLLSMPGTPVLYYGDELGMGDNVFLGDRDTVRTPMQWTGDRNAGFSRAEPARLYLPPIMDPVYGYGSVNVEAQSRSTGSLLNWMRRIIAVRKAHKAFGRGTLEFLHPGNRKVLAYIREHEDDVILCVANLSRSAQPVELDLARFRGRVPVELMGGSSFPPVGEAGFPYLLTLPGHAFYWFRLATEAQAPRWHQEAPSPHREPPVVVLPAGREVAPNNALLRLGKRQLAQLEKDALPAFLGARRWFAAKGEKIEKIEISEIVEMDNRVLALLGVHLAGDETGEPQLYSLPLAATWEDGKDDVYGPLAPYSVAKLRRRARVGVLHDAVAEDDFCRYLLRAMDAEERVTTQRGEIRFTKTGVFDELVGEGGVDGLSVRRSGVEQSNTSIVFGERLVVKLYRRLRRGINPELEVGRFLTEVARFEHTPPLAGAVEYQGPSGETTLAILQGFVPNQGDGWSFVLDRLALYLEDRLISPWTPGEDGADEEAEETDAFFLGLMRTLGYRTGELHKAFATPNDDPAFSPEPVGAEEFRGWAENVRREAEETLETLAHRRNGLPEELQGEVDDLLGRRDELMERLREISGLGVETIKTRHHGDYHLGQVLVSNNDFQIIDFEGEPGRPMQERRAKHSPMRDVAGMLRSFNYAAYAAYYDASIERLDNRESTERWVREWEEGTREAFLEGYQGGAAGGSSYPEDPEHAGALIELFTLEKALYEVRYELDNRPDWLGIPVRGILDLLRGHRPGDGRELDEARTQKKEEA
ncbi:MAG: GH13_16 / GH13_36 / GH13_4 / GH13_17 / GH13_ 23 / GH13 / GH13_31 / GH13_40 / GH13_29 / GH13_30 / G H13_35 / GH13_20 / GH13_2 / GH13_1 / GH13_34 / GH13 _18 / GH13_21 / GH13_19 / GH13_10 / GH13_37 [uncultured Rubrobacteraceae bacterium]|uniref:Maltokinase n=1 Tax=uncultured Rubrobacteraceae bacterium TaxID=349277 RepID=A0A6J4S5P8_9ACTN|nr:MAG: GH13_16 / GH13_36 / GH13_4 / GH13_17 / GH13_ 23 / GH13 / GH13_31 / GH13_40 / GH13_29 / GH13_30 / G H13_35 / GH13_20 / GH13_2 / GH13_1 / GH13_34 / GH13 _18 / GH13_21 / GH13_19 / GH13_10 / GH13_37 [uncultured Rubrobacteraceae bacterium]